MIPPLDLLVWIPIDRGQPMTREQARIGILTLIVYQTADGWAGYVDTEITCWARVLDRLSGGPVSSVWSETQDGARLRVYGLACRCVDKIVRELSGIRAQGKTRYWLGIE